MIRWQGRQVGATRQASYFKPLLANSVRPCSTTASAFITSSFSSFSLFVSPRGIFNKTHPSPLSKKHPLNAQPWPGWVAGCRVWADSNTTPSGPSCRARAPIPMSRLIPRPVSVFPRCGSFGQSRQLSAGPRARTAHLDVSLWSGVKTHHSVRTNVCSSMTCMLFKRPKARSYEHFQT